MNKKLVFVVACIALAIVLVTVTVLLTSSKEGANSSIPMDGATGDIYSGADLESIMDTWIEFVESTNQGGGLELEVTPNTTSSFSDAN